LRPIGFVLLRGGVEDLVDNLGKGAVDLEPFGPRLQLSAKLLAARLLTRALLAARTKGGAPLEAGVCGLQLAIGGEQRPGDEAECPEEAAKDGQRGLDGGRVHAAAEVAQIVLSRNGLVQTGELARAAALLRLAELRTEAGIGGVAIHPAGHLQAEGAGRIVAVAPFFGRVGGKAGAGKAQLDRGADQPTESPLDLTLSRILAGSGLQLGVG
jgi:hypothetical protein